MNDSRGGMSHFHAECGRGYSCFFSLSGPSAIRAAPTHKKLHISLDSGLKILKIFSAGRSLIDIYYEPENSVDLFPVCSYCSITKP